MSKQPARLDQGGAIDRARPLRFTWEGRCYTGYAGDTLASALVANGIRLIGRSFKYHRPRGLLGAGAEEPNALVQLGEGSRSTPNVRATEVPLYDGLVARPVNCWPSSRWDIGAVNDLGSRFLAAGFYYKTFMWPDWHLFEGSIRKAAGLGRAAAEPDPDRYEARFLHCDVLVVGGGPAGLAAARAASVNGARVVLAEQDTALGGNLLVDDARIDGLSGADWIARSEAEIRANRDALILLRTSVAGYHDHNSLTLIEQLANEAQCAADPRLARSRSWIVRAGRVILATGAIERPLVFPGNDRPGIMLAGASRAYARRWAALPGRRPVVFTNNDDAYRTAIALADAGAQVQAVVDVRAAAAPDLAGEMAQRGIPLHAGAQVVATRGRGGISAVQVRSADGACRWLTCDHLAMSGGYNPATHLFSQSGGAQLWDEGIAAFVPGRSAQRERSVGAAAGDFALRQALRAGHEAGLEAVSSGGLAAPDCAEERTELPVAPCWLIAGKGKAFVDFQNDVSAADIELAARENYRSVEHLKRYTTLGMAPDQGKTGNVNALAIMASLTGRSVPETGHTRYRFPFTPIALGAMATRNRGELYRPLRRLPAHERHVAAGALMEDFGGWLRPLIYPRPGESEHDAEQREALAVRTGAGLFEASPLGKIEVTGPDAAKFLNLIYANRMDNLKPGRIRYGIMLDETGTIIDDGVVVCRGEDDFLVVTSSGGADRIAAWLEEWLQCEWLDFDVLVAPVTSAWGVLTLTGPRAKAILRSLGTDIALDRLVHMTFAEGELGDIPVRILRVSYTGEASYEINVPANRTGELWDALMRHGAEFGITPVGVGAWMILRAEKGYLHLGGDTDGTTNILDVGWGHVLAKPVDFVGKRSLLRPDDQRADRLQFVGLEALDGAAPLPVGAHVRNAQPGAYDPSDGYVSTAVFSPVLGRAIALGRVRGGFARKGETIEIVTAAGPRRARIVDPAFYDPAGERLND